MYSSCYQKKGGLGSRGKKQVEKLQSERTKRTVAIVHTYLGVGFGFGLGSFQKLGKT